MLRTLPRCINMAYYVSDVSIIDQVLCIVLLPALLDLTFLSVRGILIGPSSGLAF
jgi:hypothetical protein